MKRANYLLIVYNNGLKKPIQLWVSAKARSLGTSQSNPLEKRFAVPTAAAQDTNAPAQQTQASFVCRYLTTHHRELCLAYKGAHQDRQVKLQRCKRNQDLVQ